IDDAVFHYLDVLDGLGLDRVHLVGVSLGGWIAAELAIRHPERITRLVLADAFGLRLNGHAAPDVAAALADPSTLRSLLFADPAGPMADVAVPLRAAGDERSAWALRAAEAMARLGGGASLEDPKLAGRLRRATMPALVVWGERDPLLPLAHAEAFRDGLAKAELDVIPSCGHLPHFEQERRFVDTVREFLTRGR